jgi:hypothetical protein
MTGGMSGVRRKIVVHARFIAIREQMESFDIRC